jgi:hypothetical protein
MQALADNYHGYGPQLSPDSLLGLLVIVVFVGFFIWVWWYGTKTNEAHKDWLEALEKRIDVAITAEIQAGHDVEFIQEQYRRERHDRHRPRPYSYTTVLLQGRGRTV